MTAPAITLVELLRNTVNDIGTATAFDITSSFLGSVTPTTGAGTVTYAGASVTRSGLTPGTAYYYWLSVTDQAGLNTVQYLGTITTAAAGPQPDISAAVDFDGTNDYLRGSVSNTIDSKTGTFSMWYRTDADPSVAYYPLCLGSASAFGLSIGKINSVPYEFYQLIGSTGGFAYRTYSNATVAGNRDWRHVLMSWDLATTTVHVYVNDAAPSLTTLAAATNVDVRWSGSDWTIGARPVDDFHVNGCIAEVYATDEYIDITVEANRRKFISATGAPVSLGANGSLPTGTQPLIYVSGAAGNWNAGKNFGSAGDFTVTGALTDCASSPGVSSALAATVTSSPAPSSGSLSTVLINDGVSVNWSGGSSYVVTITFAEPRYVTSYDVRITFSTYATIKMFDVGDNELYTLTQSASPLLGTPTANIANVSYITATVSYSTTSYFYKLIPSGF
eukprot:jgi/Tetstr1/433528/TSEL_022796.t1